MQKFIDYFFYLLYDFIMENIFNQLPKEFLDRIKKQLSNEKFEKFKQSFSEKARRGLRINNIRSETETIIGGLDVKLKSLSFCDDGYEVLSEEKLGNSPEHLSGAIYVQEPSSMLAVAVSGIEKEQRPLRVLDLCAAPGGKSSQIASRISEDSILFLNEIIKSRAQILFSNIERQGFKNVIVLNEEPKNLQCFNHYFDYIFVDAPCSGEGMFRKNPETISEWSEENVKMCANRQREILEIAINLLAQNGKLIYSTCTFSEEEDENIIEWLVSEKNFELLDVSDEIKAVTEPASAKVKNSEFARKAYQFNNLGEGQFVAVLKNNSDQERVSIHKKKHFNSIFEIGNNNYKIASEFFKQNLDFEPKKMLLEVGDNIYLKPIAFDCEIQTMLDGLKFVSIGARVGSVQKDRFEPNHNLFMAYNKHFKININLNKEQLKKYLHGEELMCDITPQNKANYAVLNYNDMPIGGGKIVQNKIKNLYPKGMRI